VAAGPGPSLLELSSYLPSKVASHCPSQAAVAVSYFLPILPLSWPPASLLCLSESGTSWHPASMA
jgi:hypothetical protein